MGEPAPAFQFYAADFLMGTLQMTLEARGAYVTLLIHQWDAGFVPGDDLRALGAILGVPPRHASLLWTTLGHKFTRGTDGRWRNARLELVRAEQAAYRAGQSQKGKASAAKRWTNCGNRNRGDAPVITGLLTDAQPNGNSPYFSTNTSPPLPPPSGGRSLPEADLTREERAWALEVIKARGCTHTPTCTSNTKCAGKLVGQRRAEFRDGLKEGAHV
jgi:uncharacterized protein YdaU (DUF1376 family)